ncbi:MAG: sugar ABC transporter ATP-binding protein, partial [Chthoniobacteraceae bacterium]
MNTTVLSAQHITKRFPGVVALMDVSFDLRAGEIHALCGENGAGKSTLIKLLSGIHPHGTYEGELMVNRELAHFRGVADAERAGLAVIYQELALVDELTVAENIFLGAEPRRGLFIDGNRMRREARELLARFGVALDPDLPCSRLGVGQKQLVEIVKALRKETRILILDEPTAALAEHEVQTLLKILRDLRERGIACIYISHKLEEVFAIADRITVLRDGSSVATQEISQTSPAEIIRQMVGREITDLFPRRTAKGKADPILRVNALNVADPHTGQPFLRDITFTVAPGEVLGFGGLMGAGRTELLMHLFGTWGRRLSGIVVFNGETLPPLPASEILRRGIALVSEDRRRFGLVLEQSIAFNLSLSSLASATRGGFIDASREHARNAGIFRSLQVKAPNLEVITG